MEAKQLVVVRVDTDKWRLAFANGDHDKPDPATATDTVYKTRAEAYDAGRELATANNHAIRGGWTNGQESEYPDPADKTEPAASGPTYDDGGNLIPPRELGGSD